MEILLNRFRNLTVLLVVILAQLVLLAYQVKSNEDIRLIRVWSVTAVTPIAKVLEFVRRNTIGVVENYIALVKVRQQNRDLLAELGRLKMENQFLRTELSTADRARALQNFQARTPSRTLPARIIGTGTGANARVVFVDQGSGAGVMRGMAVVTPDGIVGKVLSAYPTASQVLLVTDPTFAAGVISDKNRVHGTLKGLGQSKCLVDYIQNEEKVEVGEMFYTSGDDRVFPKGMPAGKVSVVRQGKTFKEIFVVPSGFQHGLEEVLIVLEGVHQAIPESQVSAAPGIYIMPAPQQPSSGAPPATATPVPAVGAAPSVMTDADRLRERYKQIGAAQNHVYGTGLPGSRPPDFNLDPKTAKPQTPVPSNPLGQPPGPAASKPAPPAAEPAASKRVPPAAAPAARQPSVVVEIEPVKPKPVPPRDTAPTQ